MSSIRKVVATSPKATVLVLFGLAILIIIASLFAIESYKHFSPHKIGLYSSDNILPDDYQLSAQDIEERVVYKGIKDFSNELGKNKISPEVYNIIGDVGTGKSTFVKHAILSDLYKQSSIFTKPITIAHLRAWSSAIFIRDYLRFADELGISIEDKDLSMIAVEVSGQLALRPNWEIIIDDLILDNKNDPTLIKTISMLIPRKVSPSQDLLESIQGLNLQKEIDDILRMNIPENDSIIAANKLGATLQKFLSTDLKGKIFFIITTNSTPQGLYFNNLINLKDDNHYLFDESACKSLIRNIILAHLKEKVAIDDSTIDIEIDHISKLFITSPLATKLAGIHLANEIDSELKKGSEGKNASTVLKEFQINYAKIAKQRTTVTPNDSAITVYDIILNKLLDSDPKTIEYLRLITLFNGHSTNKPFITNVLSQFDKSVDTDSILKTLDQYDLIHFNKAETSFDFSPLLLDAVYSINPKEEQQAIINTKKKYYNTAMEAILTFFNANGLRDKSLKERDAYISDIESLSFLVGNYFNGKTTISKEDASLLINYIRLIDALGTFYTSSALDHNSAIHLYNQGYELVTKACGSLKGLSVDLIINKLSKFHKDLPAWYGRLLYIDGRTYTYSRVQKEKPLAREKLLLAKSIFDRIHYQDGDLAIPYLEKKIVYTSGLLYIDMESNDVNDILKVIEDYQTIIRDPIPKYVITSNQVLPAKDEINISNCSREIAKCYIKLARLDVSKRDLYFANALNHMIGANDKDDSYYLRTSNERSKTSSLVLLAHVLLINPDSNKRFDDIKNLLSTLNNSFKSPSIKTNRDIIEALLECAHKEFQSDDLTLRNNQKIRPAVLSQLHYGIAKLELVKKKYRSAKKHINIAISIQKNLGRKKGHPDYDTYNAFLQTVTNLQDLS